MISDTVSVLKQNRLFAAVPAADVAAILAGHRVLSLPHGTTVFTENSPAEFLYLVLSGEMEVTPSATSPHLRLSAGDSVGEEAVLTRTHHTATARALSNLQVLALSGATLMAYLETHFDVAIAMISSLAGNLREQVREITELKMQSTAERLASYLLALAGDATGRAVVRLPYEKRHLADHLGMDPATLSRAFAKLRDKGVVASRTDKVEIADVATLRTYGDCAAFTA